MPFSGTARWQSKMLSGNSVVSQRVGDTVLLRCIGATRIRVAAGRPMQTSFDAPNSGAGRVGVAESAAVVAQIHPPLLLPEHGTHTSPGGGPTNGSGSSSEQRQRVLSEVRSFLADELEGVWATGAIDVFRERIAPDVTFLDPIFSYSGRDTYLWNLRALRAAFDVTYTLHRIESREPSEIVTRFSMLLRSKALPWQPAVTVTGRTFYSVDTASGSIMSHREEWDAVENQSYPSLEALAYVARSLARVQLTPKLDTPQYTVLKATADYEIRQYSDFMVAEVAMPAGSGPGSGDGFNELAGYIFGGNTRRSKMEMTTPVFSTAGQRGNDVGLMSFPMESQYGTNVDALPEPQDQRIERKVQKGGVVAALTFPGLPADWEVTSAERSLRGALLLDKLDPCTGYRLARYNEPFVPPPFRRNEILIEIQDFEL